jgi:flagellar motility protein MotE (MotC chaperone)
MKNSTVRGGVRIVLVMSGIMVAMLFAAAASELFSGFAGPFFSRYLARACAVAEAAGEKVKSSGPVGDCCHPELVEILNARKRELDQRAAELDRRERELDLVRDDIEAKIAELKALLKKLKGPVDNALAEREKNFKHLVGVYGKMDPARAAALLDRMKEKDVARLLAAMKAKQVAAIFANMDPARAARISAMISE